MSLDLVFPHTFVPWFRAVAPHIHAYHGKTFVVAITGEALAAHKLNAVAQDLAILHAMGMKLVLVHGFRPQVNDQLKAKNHPARYSHGIRITDEVALDCAQEAAGQLRFEIEAAFSQGLPNTPMANATVRVVSGNFLTARPVGIVDGVDFMHSGVVRKVDATAIRRAIDIGAVVLLSPFGFSPTGEAFNLTMEEVATSTAVALQADKLLFLTEVPGIHEVPNDPETPIDTELALADAERLVASLPAPHTPFPMAAPPVPARPPREERRPVTVLFAEVAAPPGLAGTLGLFSFLKNHRLRHRRCAAAKALRHPVRTLRVRILPLHAVQQGRHFVAQRRVKLLDVARRQHRLTRRHDDRDLLAADISRVVFCPNPLRAPDDQRNHRYSCLQRHPRRAGLELLELETATDRRLGHQAYHLAGLE